MNVPSIPSHLKYTEDHVWVLADGGVAKIGVTDFAQHEFGDIVFVELPRVGDEIIVGEPLGSMESVKTVTELYAPLSGRVVEVNQALEDAPGTINTSPYGDAWLIAIEPSNITQLDRLWSADRYRETYGD